MTRSPALPVIRARGARRAATGALAAALAPALAALAPAPAGAADTGGRQIELARMGGAPGDGDVGGVPLSQAPSRGRFALITVSLRQRAGDGAASLAVDDLSVFVRCDGRRHLAAGGLPGSLPVGGDGRFAGTVRSSDGAVAVSLTGRALRDRQEVDASVRAFAIPAALGDRAPYAGACDSGTLPLTARAPAPPAVARPRPVTVPRLIGLAFGLATRRLAAAGLAPDAAGLIPYAPRTLVDAFAPTVTVRHVSAGRPVSAQSPAPGRQAPSGTPVRLSTVFASALDGPAAATASPAPRIAGATLAPDGITLTLGFWERARCPVGVDHLLLGIAGAQSAVSAELVPIGRPPCRGSSGPWHLRHLRVRLPAPLAGRAVVPASAPAGPPDPETIAPRPRRWADASPTGPSGSAAVLAPDGRSAAITVPLGPCERLAGVDIEAHGGLALVTLRVGATETFYPCPGPATPRTVVLRLPGRTRVLLDGTAPAPPPAGGYPG